MSIQVIIVGVELPSTSADWRDKKKIRANTLMDDAERGYRNKVQCKEMYINRDKMSRNLQS